MTRRARLESRLTRRREWADSASRKASSAFSSASSIADNIPHGQPILVGHHSERHARRDQEKIRSRMNKGCELEDKAQHHSDKAAGLEAQLDRSVFSDDPDAIERLEARIVELESRADHYAAINKAWRKSKGDVEALVASGLVSRTLADTIITTMRLCPYLSSPLDTTNLRADIRRNRIRIDQIKKDQARYRAAVDAGGIKIIRNPAANWCTVTFQERPDRSIIQDLKDAGFGYGGGSWSGRLDALPGVVVEMERYAAEREDRV